MEAENEFGYGYEAEEEGEDDEVLNFVTSYTSEEPGWGPDELFTLRTSSNGTKYIWLTQELPLRDILVRENIGVMANTTFWLNDAQVDLDTIVGPGVTMDVVGALKGA